MSYKIVPDMETIKLNKTQDKESRVDVKLKYRQIVINL